MAFPEDEPLLDPEVSAIAKRSSNEYRILSVSPSPDYSSYQLTTPLIDSDATLLRRLRNTKSCGWFRVRTRFSMAFCRTLLFFVLFSLLALSFLDPIGWLRDGWDSYDGLDGVPNSKTVIKRCNGIRNWNPVLDSTNISEESDDSVVRLAKTSFSLPVSSNLLFLVARGPLASGSVKIRISNETRDDVRIDIVAHFHTDEALMRARVCVLHPEEGRSGVGIFTPSRWTRASVFEQLRFDIIVSFPASSSGEPLFVGAFVTHLRTFEHNLGDIAGKVEFGSLTLRSSDAHVFAESLYAESATIMTKNAPIRGSFNTSRSLHLITSNALIRASVGLSNLKESAPTELVLKTSNGPLHSEISMFSTTQDGERGGSFRVSAATSNSRLKVIFPISPVDSELHFDAESSNAPTIVRLHSAYEGSFYVASDVIGPSLRHRTVEDPAGEGRERIVQVHRVDENLIQGDAYWHETRKNAGSVTLRTSNSPAALYLY